MAHGAEPLVLLYWLAWQATQGPPSGPEKPWKHWHALASVCAESACPEFASQAVHAAEPLAALYVDAGHAVHGPPSAPVYPAAHLQSVERLLPLEDCEFAGHAVQLAAPVLALYLPATHASHCAVPLQPTAVDT